MDELRERLRISMVFHWYMLRHVCANLRQFIDQI